MLRTIPTHVHVSMLVLSIYYNRKQSEVYECLASPPPSLQPWRCPLCCRWAPAMALCSCWSTPLTCAVWRSTTSSANWQCWPACLLSPACRYDAHRIAVSEVFVLTLPSPVWLCCTQGMADELLPARVGRVVDAVYCPPLLLQLCHEGTVCILLSLLTN